MSIAMFIVGFFIFVAYAILLIWNIFYSARKNREENYPNYYSRHGYPHNRVSKMKGKKEEVE